MEQNVLRLGQVLSGTMKRPGMILSSAKFADFAVIFFYLQQKIMVKSSEVELSAAEVSFATISWW